MTVNGFVFTYVINDVSITMCTFTFNIKQLITIYIFN